MGVAVRKAWSPAVEHSKYVMYKFTVILHYITYSNGLFRMVLQLTVTCVSTKNTSNAARHDILGWLLSNSIISVVQTHKYSIISGRKISMVFHFQFNGRGLIWSVF